MFESLTANKVLMAFGLTILAGLATGIGSLIALFSKRINGKYLAVALGFSAGVMIYVSFVEILPKAQRSLALVLGERTGAWAAVGAFFLGIIILAIIDKLIPEAENPHEIHHLDENKARMASLHRTGIFVAIAIAIHNFPEGIVTFMNALHDPGLGIVIALAIALHNIPEGIAVAVPIYHATGDRKKAFIYSLLSGLTELLGAVVAFFFLRQHMGALACGLVFAMVAGIMVFISIDELIPSAEEYGEHHHCIYGFVAGMALMAVSLLFFI
jgi:zinc transporter, ZIP family